MKKILVIVALFFALPAWAGGKAVKVTGALPSGYSAVTFYSQKGFITSGRITGTKFSISVPSKDLKDGRIILLKTGGQFGGSLVLAQKGTKSFVQFAATTASAIPLGKIVDVAQGYAKLKKSLRPTAYNKKSFATTSLLGAPLGLNVGSFAVTSVKASSRIHSQSVVSSDSDNDGVPNGVDVDSQGSGSVDGLTLGASSSAQAPYLIVRENMSNTINYTATGIPSASAIDDILTSDSSSQFVMGFGFGIQQDLSRITGAHIVCDDNSPLCGRTAGLATVNSISNGLWRDYHPDGTTYPGLELQSSGPGEKFFNTGIAPHVGPSAILPGDTYRIEFTGAGGSVIRSELATVSPYLVTVPALHSYTANGSDHTVDYGNIGTEPGASMGIPITLGSDGILTINFWRPQRQGLGGADGSNYVDTGHLRYGLVLLGVVGLGGGPGDTTCGGLYSSPSESLTDTGASGEHDFWPLNDSAEDSTPSESNLLSFTVDLKTCATRAGYTTGQNFMVSLQAAGPDLGHGSNRSGQDFIVAIP